MRKAIGWAVLFVVFVVCGMAVQSSARAATPAEHALGIAECLRKPCQWVESDRGYVRFAAGEFTFLLSPKSLGIAYDEEHIEVWPLLCVHRQRRVSVWIPYPYDGDIALAIHAYGPEDMPRVTMAGDPEFDERIEKRTAMLRRALKEGWHLIVTDDIKKKILASSRE